MENIMDFLSINDLEIIKIILNNKYLKFEKISIKQMIDRINDKIEQIKFENEFQEKIDIYEKCDDPNFLIWNRKKNYFCKLVQRFYPEYFFKPIYECEEKEFEKINDYASKIWGFNYPEELYGAKIKLQNKNPKGFYFKTAYNKKITMEQLLNKERKLKRSKNYA